MAKAEQPIGIFDSGVGGLTVAAAIKQLLPKEDLIYFGDTAHLPYGDKSSETIINYSRTIADFLLGKGVKVIVVACNTASAVAYQALLEYLGDQVHIVNVIDPAAEYVTKNYAHDKIGVIGTKGTINSGTYERKILDKKLGIKIESLATPLFVPMIEEGFIYDDISNAIIRSYLTNERLKDIKSLILGCTHYPIIKNQIRKFFNFTVDIVDSAHVVASSLKNLLDDNELLNESKKGTHTFYVSDYTDYFETIARMFFEERINLKKINIWKE